MRDSEYPRSRPILLDTFCKAGGATKGYQRAGFYVIGVDIEPQPNYCGDEFVQADALDYLTDLCERMEADAGAPSPGRGTGVVAIHASPPCQAFSDLQKQNKRDYPELIEPVRALLKRTRMRYVIENVEGAPLIDPVTLCGTAFPGLRVIRHRLFESNVLPLVGTPCPARHPLVFTHDKRKGHYGKLDQDTAFVQVTGGGNCTVANKADAMGIDWMTGAELNEAIPPAYTEWIGWQVRFSLARQAVQGERWRKPHEERVA